MPGGTDSIPGQGTKILHAKKKKKKENKRKITFYNGKSQEEHRAPIGGIQIVDSRENVKGIAMDSMLVCPSQFIFLVLIPR